MIYLCDELNKKKLIKFCAFSNWLAKGTKFLGIYDFDLILGCLQSKLVR